MAPGDLVILNGLPRHAGQADAIAAFLTVRQLIVLHGTPAVVHARIRSNTGGDRAQRVDDSVGEIRSKLEIFEARTRPLIEYYVACAHFAKCAQAVRALLIPRWVGRL